MIQGDDDIPELTYAEKIGYRATESDFTAMGDALRNGTATPDGAFARLLSMDYDRDKHACGDSLGYTPVTELET